MRRFALPLAALAMLLALFGCTQGGVPAACANSSGPMLANCVYVSSVLGQNPYDCYSIQNTSQREKCLRDASDSAARKLLEQMTPAERARIFAAASDAIAAAGIEMPLPVPSGPASPAAEPVPIIPPSGVSESDSQAYTQAIAANDMSPCTAISDASTRASCITQVALQVKNPTICSQLTQKPDIDLCNLYAKEGEQAK